MQRRKKDFAVGAREHLLETRSFEQPGLPRSFYRVRGLRVPAVDP